MVKRKKANGLEEIDHRYLQAMNEWIQIYADIETYQTTGEHIIYLKERPNPEATKFPYGLRTYNQIPKQQIM